MSLGRYQEVTQETDALTDRKQRLDEENAELASILRKLRSQLEKEEPQCAELRKEISSKTEVLKTLNNEQAELQAQTKTTKASIHAVTEKISADQFLVISGKQEAGRFRSQIVQSPEKLKRTIANLAHAVDEEKDKVNSIDKATLDMKTRLEGISRVEKEISKIFKVLETAEADKNKAKELKQEAKTIQENISSIERNAREASTNEQLVKRQASSSNERSSRLGKQFSLKIGAAEQALNLAKSELDGVFRTAVAANEQVQRENVNIQRLRKHIDEHKRNHAIEVERIRDQFAELERQVASYHSALFSALSDSQVNAQNPVSAQ